MASVLWGESEDEDPEVLEGFLASHRYSYQGPSVDYQGVILVRDIHGATARKEFLATVVDSPTVIRDMTMSVVSRVVFICLSLLTQMPKSCGTASIWTVMGFSTSWIVLVESFS